LPREWRNIQIPGDGQNSYVLYFNNNKSVSMLRLRENIEHTYENSILPIIKLEGMENIAFDRNEFVEECLSRFIIISPNSSYEFAFGIRAIPSLIKQYRPIGLVIIDSINAFSLYDYEFHKESNDPTKNSSIILDPNATSFEIRAKGIGTKKRKSKAYEQNLYTNCCDFIKQYFEEYKYPMIITKIDNTSIAILDKKLLESPKYEDTEDEKSNSFLKICPYPALDMQLKRLENDQIIIISDHKCKLYEQALQTSKIINDQGFIVISKVPKEEQEFDILSLFPRENTLYVELQTIDRKKIKLNTIN